MNFDSPSIDNVIAVNLDVRLNLLVFHFNVFIQLRAQTSDQATQIARLLEELNTAKGAPSQKKSKR